MNYSIYLIHDSDFHQINKKINLSPNSKCIGTQGYNYNDKCILQVNNGYHKPLNELCMEKHYKIEVQMVPKSRFWVPRWPLGRPWVGPGGP